MSGVDQFDSWRVIGERDVPAGSVGKSRSADCLIFGCRKLTTGKNTAPSTAPPSLPLANIFEFWDTMNHHLTFTGEGSHPAISQVRHIDAGAYGDVYEVREPVNFS
jgi:hypothetical protein